MALMQSLRSSRSANDFLKKAVWLFMVFATLVAPLKAAQYVDWSVFVTAVFIHSTSSEKNFTPRILIPDSHILTTPYSNEQIMGIVTARVRNTYTRSSDPEETPGLFLRSRGSLKSAKVNLVRKQWSISGKYSDSSLGAGTNNEKDAKWRTSEDYPYESNIRRKREEKISCTEIEGSMGCECTENRIYCDNVDISDLVLPNYLSLKVEHISVSNNHLRGIPAIRNAPRLSKLSLRRNEINDVNMKELEHFLFLESLDLSSNELQALNLNDVDLVNLKILDASSNKLTTILMQPSNLSHLYLQRNCISDISFLSQLEALESVDLSYNRITYIPENTFKALTFLYRLDLKNNAIKSAEFVSDITKLLHTLVLSNNQISYIPEMSFKNSKIVELYVDNNALTSITFLIYVNAAEINLNDNQLSSIDGKLFEKKTKLKVLNVSGTNLTSMEFITSIPSLISLGIEENNITCLPKNFLKTYSSLGEWFLLKNPLENLICPVSPRLNNRIICNESVIDGKIYINMQHENINHVMNCVLNRREIFEDCEQKCNSASQIFFLSFLIITSIIFNVI